MLQNIRPEANGIQGLVLAPTRSWLSKLQGSSQTSSTFRIRAVPIYGGRASTFRWTGCRSESQIVVGNAGRLTDHMKEDDKARQREVVVLDEADRMLDMASSTTSTTYSIKFQRISDRAVLRHHASGSSGLVSVPANLSPYSLTARAVLDTVDQKLFNLKKTTNLGRYAVF